MRSLVITVLLMLAFCPEQVRAQIFEQDPSTGFQLVNSQLQDRGRTSVIVRLRVAEYRPEGTLDEASRRRQRETISDVQDRLLASLSGTDAVVRRRYRLIPYIAIEVSESSLGQLRSNGHADVLTVDLRGKPDLIPTEQRPFCEDPATASVPSPAPMDTSRLVVGADVANANGCDGADWSIVIIDSGIDLDHDAFTGRITEQACFSTHAPGVEQYSLCPGSATSATGPGTGEDCKVCTSQSQTDCDFQPPFQRACPHGTLVAGSAAGNGGGVVGIAPQADLISIRVFTRYKDPSECDLDLWTLGCPFVNTSDLLAALEHAALLSETEKIAAVNVSVDLTGTPGTPWFNTGFSEVCDGEAALSGVKDAVDVLRSYGIPTTASTGNQNNHNRINPPACLSNVISVGYTQDGSFHYRDFDGGHPTTVDEIGNHSNRDTFLDFWAPGEWITTAWPDNTTSTERGSSVAAPQVAGAIAALRSKGTASDPDYYQNLLASTGVMVTDTRPDPDITKPRIDVGAACLALDAITLDAKILLEGAYQGSGLMSAGVIRTDSMPLTQPFADTALAGTPLAYSGSESAPVRPADAVDWVRVGLRTAADPGTLVSESPAFVLSDGSIVNPYGGDLGFVGLDSASYFVVVRHPNHLPLMSSAAVDFSSGIGTYDFTDAAAKAHTTGQLPSLKDLGDGRFGMFSGDVNGDGLVTAVDFLSWLEATRAGASGYEMADFDLDGEVTVSDFLIWLQNTRSGAASNVPEN